MVVTDAGQQIVYVNDAAAALLGWPVDELVGQPLLTIIPPRLHSAHQAGFARYFATRVPKIIGRALRVSALRRDGSEVEVDLVLSALETGPGDVLIAGSLRDVRAHVALERQIAVTRYLHAATRAAATLTAQLDVESILRTVVETLVHDLDAALARIWLYDPATNALRLRASAGLSTETATSSRAHIDVATYPYKVGAVARSRAPFVKNGLRGDAQFDQSWVEREQIVGVAVFPVLLAGELCGVLLHFSRQPLFDDIVEVLATFSTMVATSLNHARLFAREQAARTEAEQAQHELAALAEANARLLRQVQEASRQREELISTATHDLKNPLLSVKGLAQVLHRHVSQDQSPSVERLLRGLSGIDTAAERMAALIDEMLDIAHLQAGAPLALERAPVDLVALARQAVAQYQQSTERHQLRVETALDALVCALDAARLERVLGNLLSNAIKFSPQGGEIVVTVAREGDEWAMLEVRDQGLGIPTADLPHIFERGHRGSNVAGRVSGWGIGLAGARQIIEQHGGAIAVRGQPGAGATFTIRLPLAAVAI